MDPHNITNNLNLAHSDQSKPMPTIQNGQNLSHTPYQSKEQISATADLRFSAEGNQDSPRRPQEFLNSVQAQSSTSNCTLSHSSSVQPQIPPEAALKLIQGILKSQSHKAGTNTESANIGSLSNSDGVSAAQDTPSAVLNMLRSISEAQREVSAFDKDGGNRAGLESLTDKPQSVSGSGQAQLASSAEHHNRDNMINQTTFATQPNQQQFSNGQQQMLPQQQNMIHYLQNFLNVQGGGQPANGQVFQMPLVFDNSQVQNQQFMPQIQQFVQTYGIPQAGTNVEQVMQQQQQMVTMPQFNQVLAAMQQPVHLDEQHIFLQQLQEQQRVQMSQLAAQVNQKDLTMESLLRQLGGQQMMKEHHSLEQLTRQLAQQGYFNSNGEIGLQNFYTQNLVCSSCQQDGELICCQICKKPYHLMCAGLQQVPQRWECEVCATESRDNLIRQLKEKAQKKLLEREKRKEDERLAKNEAKLKRELEARQRKEERDRQREEQRKQRAEILAQAAKERREDALKLRLLQQSLSFGKDQFIDPETNQPYPVEGPLKEGQERYELLENVIQIAAQQTQPKQMQLVFGPNGALVQSNPQTKKKKIEVDLTPEERQRFERIRLVKQQFQIFNNLYPELVERNSIRYPIKDELLMKLPELHGCCMDQKPEPYKIFVDADEFEKLIYIWEFCNNFSDYLYTPTFKLEDLKCALSYNEAEDPNNNLTVQEEQSLDWNEQMRVRHIREKGLHLINALHTALVTCFLDDFFPENNAEEPTGGANTRAAAGATAPVQLVSAQGDRENQILQAIDKLIDNKEEVWPEIIRLVLLYQIEVLEADFGPHRDMVETIHGKLVGLRPNQYNKQLTFDEKVCLMTVLIDGIHDTDTFRKSLNDRVEEKSSFNKEKIEVYQVIRQLEQEQQELLKKHAESNFVSNEEAINKELEELRERLKVASRVQSRDLKDRIHDLEFEKNHFLNENSRLDEIIKKKHAHIAKLNEKLYKSSIKTTMLGQDAHRSEYWHFKDDCSRIYIRKEETQTTDVEMADGTDEIVTEAVTTSKIVYSWYYYDREEQLDQLIERLNYKGIRERRLQESLRKVKDILKLKKTRKPKVATDSEPKPAEEKQKEEAAKSENDDENRPNDDSNAEKADEPMNAESEPAADGSNKIIDEKDDEQSESVSMADKHVMFETDNFEACLLTAVWFGKKVPGKRRLFGRGSNKFETSEFGDNPVTLQECKNILVRIQNLYTDSSRVHDREWSDKADREQWTKSAAAAESCQELTSLMIKLDEGMNMPYFMTQRGGNSQRLKLQKFKFWPSTDLKSAWCEYVEDKNSLASENINAFYIILRILERINEQFLVRQDEKMEKKNKAAINAACSGSDVKANAFVIYAKGGRPRDVNYVKYFESSDSEDEMTSTLLKNTKKDKEEEQEEDQSEEEGEREQTLGGKSAVSARQQRAVHRKKKDEPTKSVTNNRNTKGGKKRVVQNESEDEKSSGSEKFSDEEESESEEEVKRPTRGRGLASERQQPTNTRGGGRRGRGGRAISRNVKQESEDEESDQESSEESNTSREWDEYCYVCNDGGNVLCCESCTQVAHVQCLKLRSAPTGDWHCPDCLKKQTMKRLTRNQDNKTTAKETRSTRNSGKPIKAMRRY